MSDHRIAIIVDPTLPLGFLANTVATIAVGIGAAQPIFGNTVLTDVAGRSIGCQNNVFDKFWVELRACLSRKELTIGAKCRSSLTI